MEVKYSLRELCFVIYLRRIFSEKFRFLFKARYWKKNFLGLLRNDLYL